MPVVVQRPPLRTCTFSAEPRAANSTLPRSAQRALAAVAPGAGVPPVGSDGAGTAGAVLIVLKYAQVSNSPSFARSVDPLTVVEPREPTTCAVMIRGDTPR